LNLRHRISFAPREQSVSCTDQNKSKKKEMCGISGFVGKGLNEPTLLLRRFNDSQSHRGPDAEGIWLSADRRVGLAHRRLSIVDLSANGNQPMRSETGRYVITMNGEIYNFRNLRHELTSLGHRFRGTSDTEVMLAGFEQWGIEDSLGRFNGMFAAAVWDEASRKGYLFRDRLGVKPLYYQWHAGTLFFSSELTPPFARLCARTISRDGLALLLRQGYVPAPYSIYEGILKLPPGVIAAVSVDDAGAGQFGSLSRYWDTQERINKILSNHNGSMTGDQALDELDATLRRSVRDRMISDVPLGAFLSGGIDSSLIVSFMREVSTSEVRTFTIGFEDRALSEAPYARKVAEHLETTHTEMLVTDRDALDVVPRLCEFYSEPFADSSQIPTYLVSKLARENVKVVLTGDAGDELFGGYSKYQSILRYRKAALTAPTPVLKAVSALMTLPRISRSIHRLLGDQHVTRLLGGVRVFSAERKMNLRSDHWGPLTLPERLVMGASPGASIQSFPECCGNAAEQAMSHDLVSYLPDDILVKVDRASMAVSLEARAPFADDFELFDLAWKIPFALKMNELGGKLILRRLLARFVPPMLTERPKMGFAVPLSKWLRGALKDWLGDCISPGRLEQEGYLRPNEVDKVRKRALRGEEFYVHKLWAICQFQSWLSTAKQSPELRIESDVEIQNAISCSALGAPLNISHPSLLQGTHE
jgi:asparagine synthase (glutamine-hydrolysing)